MAVPFSPTPVPAHCRLAVPLTHYILGIDLGQLSVSPILYDSALITNSFGNC